MSYAGSRLPVLPHLATVLRRAWLPICGVVLTHLVAALVVVLVAMSAVSALAASQVDVVRGPVGPPEVMGALPVMLTVGIPFALALLVLTAAAVVAIARLSDDALEGRPGRFGAAVLQGLRRAPVLVAAGVLVAFAVGLLVLAAPLLVFAGVAGLLLTPVIHLARRRRPSARWPAVVPLVVLAVPLAPAVMVGLRLALVVPAVALERNGVLASLRRGGATAAANWHTVAVSLGVVLVAVLAVSAGLGFVEQAAPWSAALALRLVAQVALLAAPVSLATVLFRIGVPSSPGDLALRDAPPRGPGPSPALASLVVLALVAPLVVVSPTPAAAATVRSFVVDDLGDSSDADPADGLCSTDDSTCTLRAAVEEANAAEEGTSTGITLAASGTITVGSTLAVASDVVIEGTGQHVTVSGGGTTRIFDVPGSLTLRDLSLVEGSVSGESGGGAVRVSGTASIERVYLGRNTAPFGGAIYADGGSLLVSNSTFEDNDSVSGAGDLVAEGSAQAEILYSTLSGATGGSVGLLSYGATPGTMTVDSSIIAPAAGPACEGDVFAPRSRATDSTCETQHLDAPLGFAADHGGWVPTIAIGTGHNVVDAGDSTSCPATDGRGVARATTDDPLCDVGAYEYVAPLFDATVTVTSSPDPSDAGQSVEIVATVGNETEGITGTGGVTFLDGTTSLGTAALDEFGVARFTTTALPPGERALVVQFPGDGSLRAASGEDAHVVNADGTTVTVTAAPSPSSPGETVTITATVTGDAAVAAPTGTVTFRDGATTLGTRDLVAGEATFEVADLAEGAHVLAADYEGDASFTAGTGTADHTVRGTPTVTLSGPATTTVSGETATFAATVTTPGEVATGTVTFLEGAAVLDEVTLDAAGEASADLSGLTVGTHTVTATYGGDAEWVSVTSSPVEHEVGHASTTTSVTTSGSPSLIGEAVTVTATVTVSAPGTGTPAGDVVFTEGATEHGTSTLNADGVATLVVTGLAIGDHELVATYAGDDAVTGSAGSVTQVIGGVATTTTLTGSPSPSKLDDRVVFTIAVTSTRGTPRGKVRLLDGTDVLAVLRLGLDESGKETFGTTALGAGSHDVTAEYLGSDTHVASSDGLVHVVDRADTTTTVQADPWSVVTGQDVTLTATVKGPFGRGPIGTVTFGGFSDATNEAFVATVDPATGVASVTVPAPRSSPFWSDRLVTASYSGDGDLAGSSGTIRVATEAALVDVDLAVDTTTVTVGQPVTATVNLATVAPGSGIPDGTVVLYDTWTGTSVSQTTKGAATVTFVRKLAFGTHRLSATFTPHRHRDGWVSGQSDPVTVNVSEATSTTMLNVSASPTAFGQPVRMSAEVEVPDGAPSPERWVAFYDGTTHIGSATLRPIATLTYVAELTVTDLPFGTRSLTAYYGGDRGSLTSSRSAVVLHTVDQLTTATDIIEQATTAGFPKQLTIVVSTTDTRVFSRPSLTGRIELRVDGGALQYLPLTDLGGGRASATATTRALDSGDHVFRAVYDPTGDNPVIEGQTVYAASEVTLRSRVDGTAAQVTLSVGDAYQELAWGLPVPVVVTVEPSYARGAPPPTGTVTITGDGSESCTVTLPERVCNLRFSSPGMRPIAALYAGDDVYASATFHGRDAVRVTRRPATAVGQLTDRDDQALATVVTGTPVWLRWRIADAWSGDGIADSGDGATTVTVGDETCSSTWYRGICTGEFTLDDAGEDQVITVRFGGNALYEPALWKRTVTPDGCFPLPREVIGEPGATLRLDQGTNCTASDGVGFLQGSRLTATVVLPPSDGSFHYEVDWGWGDGFNARRTRVFGVGVEAYYEVTSLAPVVRRVADCGTFKLYATELTGGADGEIRLPVPNCPLDERGRPVAAPSIVVDAAGTQTGRYVIGTRIEPEIDLYGAESAFYGWVGDQDLVVTGDRPHSTRGRIGPRCHDVVLDVIGDGRGEVGLDPQYRGYPPLPFAATFDCDNPLAGRGWLAGTVLRFHARVQDGSYVDSWAGAKTANGVRNRQWDSAVTRWFHQEVVDVVVGSADGRQVVTVDLIDCPRLTVDPQLDSTWDPFAVPGTVTTSPSGTCPTSDRDDLHVRGQQVRLEATPTDATFVFARWNLDDTHIIDKEPTARVTMDADRVIRPAFLKGTQACTDVSYAVAPKDRDRASITVTPVGEDLFCDPMGFGQSTSTPSRGRVHTPRDPAPVRMLSLHAELEPDDDAQVVWIREGRRGLTSIVGRDVTVPVYRSSPIRLTMHRCHEVQPRVKIETLAGVEAYGRLPGDRPLPRGWVVGAARAGTQCGTESLTWQDATTVQLVPALDSDPGYRFVGWEGDLGGASRTDRSLVLTTDSSQPPIQVTAVFEPVCVALTTPTRGNVRLLNEPDCPGAPRPEDLTRTNAIWKTDSFGSGFVTPDDRELDPGLYSRLEHEQANLGSQYLGAFLNGSVAVVQGAIPDWEKAGAGWSDNARESGADDLVRLVDMTLDPNVLPSADGTSDSGDQQPMPGGDDFPSDTTYDEWLEAQEEAMWLEVTATQQRTGPMAVTDAIVALGDLGPSNLANPFRSEVAFAFGTNTKDWTDHAEDVFTEFVPILGKKLVGLLAASAAGYLFDVAALGALSLLLDGVGFIGSFTNLGDLETFVGYAQQSIALLSAGLDCTADWAYAGSGSSDAPADESVSRIEEGAGLVISGLGDHGGNSGSAIATAWDAYKTGSDINDQGLDGYLEGQADFMEWDASAHEAWTDTSVLTDCLEDSIPDYIKDPLKATPA